MPFIKCCPHLLPKSAHRRAVIHLRELRIPSGTNVPLWFSIWLFISTQLCPAGLMAQLNQAGRAASSATREEVASMKRRPCCPGMMGGSLSDQGPIPFSPLLHSGLPHIPPGPSQAVWLPRNRQPPYSTMRASLLAAAALGTSVPCCPKDQREHLLFIEPLPACRTQNFPQSPSPGLAPSRTFPRAASIPSRHFTAGSLSLGRPEKSHR